MSDSSEDIYIRAGEYVLGLLDAEEMAQVRRDAATDTVLVDAIGFWERRLAPLAAFVPAVAPPGWLWERIEALLGSPAAAAPTAEIIAFKPRGAPRLWQATTFVATAIAAALAVALFRPPPPAPAPAAVPPDLFAAVLPLKDELKQHGWLARLQPDGKLRVTALGSIIQPTQRDLWLWVVPKGGAPMAISAIAGNGTFSLPPGVKAETVAAVAISDEKAGITPKTPESIDYLGGVVKPE